MALYLGSEKVAGNFMPERNVMTLYKSQRFSHNLPTAYQVSILPLAEYVVAGNKLSYQSYGVKIGKGVSKILVSANIGLWSSPNTGEFGLQIFRNNDRVGMAFGNFTNGEIWGIHLSPVLVDVVEGDLIKLGVSSANVGTHNFLTDDKAVSMTVDVVA